MGKDETLERIRDAGIVGVVRADAAADAVEITAALLAAGIVAIEITLTVPDAFAAIRGTAARLGGRVLLGAGTVLDPGAAEAAVQAGAEFVASPGTVAEVITLCRDRGKVAVPGATTPTEIITARRLGADLVKVFPCGRMGGPGYIRTLRALLPQIPLLPTGGVDAANTAEYLRAGAFAVGAGTSLIDGKAVAEGRWADITETAATFVAAVQAGRRDPTA